jgi:hypothetical protein
MYTASKYFSYVAEKPAEKEENERQGIVKEQTAVTTKAL